MLRRAVAGRIASVLGAERSAWYLTILYALLVYRREHELEPLHEDVLARVGAPLAELGPYEPTMFAQDVGQLVAWGAVERATEGHKLRSYRDNRRERFRYRLSDDAVALLEWLEARLAAKLAGRAGEGRDRLVDVVGHLRELTRVLDGWRRGADDEEVARRALYLVEATSDAIDEVGGELTAFRAEMLGFAARPYDLDALRAILGWLERYVAVYVRRLEELRAEIAARLATLGAPRRREALDECHAVTSAVRARAPRSLRAAAVVPPGERLDAHATFFASDGALASRCARIDESARAVVRKMQHHLRELEQRSARLTDLRVTIRRVAAGAAVDPRLAGLVRGLVAAAQVRVDRRPGTRAAPVPPALPRGHSRTRAVSPARPLARKRGTIEAVRDLAARRRAALGTWLDEVTGGERRWVGTLDLRQAGDVRRWLDVARAAHLGRGRELRAIGYRLDVGDGEVRIGDERCGLAAPDGSIAATGGR